MAVEFNNSQHYGFFMSGTTLTNGNGYYIRWSEVVLASLRAAGFLDNMEDGTVAPSDTSKLWLDKNTDPAVLKEYNPVGAAWEQVTSQTLFGRVPWRGAWESSPIYRRADIVSYNGSIWIAVQPSQNHPPAEDAYWDVFIDGGSYVQKSLNLGDLTDFGAAQDNLQVSATFADVATGQSATIAARNKRIRLQYRTSDRIHNSGGEYRRISLADLTGYPSAAYFRSTDRIMPDGTTDNTNGGYWLLDEVVIAPSMLGAKKDDSTFDSGPAIQAAIDLGNLLKRPVHLPIGTLYTGQTLHVYAQSVLTGYGKSQSFIKLMDEAGEAEDGKGILETYDFINLTGTETKFVTDAGMTWGFVLKGFTVDGNRENNYGGVSGTRFGGVGTAVWDGFGIRLYGRRYIVEDIGVQLCAGIGFYSECGNPSSPSDPDWYYNPLNNQLGHIKDIYVNNCSYDGFVFRGPGDIFLDGIVSELCHYPDETAYDTPLTSLMFRTANGNATNELIAGMVFADKAVNNAVSGCEIGTIHSHTHKNGYAIRFQGDVLCRIRTDNITAEGSLGGIKVAGAVAGQMNKVNIRNQNVGAGTYPDFDNKTTRNLYVAEYENLANSGNAGSIRLLVGSDKQNYGTLTFIGSDSVDIPGHGVVIDTNVDHCTINKAIITHLRGTAADGNASRALWTKSGVSTVYIGQALFTDNDVGWRNDSTGEIVIAKGRIETNATTYTGTVPLDLATSPNGNGLRECGFSTNDGTTTKNNRFNGQAVIDPTITTEQSLSFTHLMWRTPIASDLALSILTQSGTKPLLDYIYATAISSTAVSVVVKFRTAGTAGTSVATLKI